MGWPKGKPRKQSNPWNDVATEFMPVVLPDVSEPPFIPPVIDLITQCNNCLYWDRLTDSSKEGLCRRFPAHPRPNDPAARWPVMAQTDWCGEFKAKG